MKKFCLLVAVSSAFVSFAVTVVPVSNTVSLVEALRKYASTSYEIQLTNGEYELSSDICMETNSACGRSHLLVRNVRLVGIGESRDDVVIRGDATMRIIHADSPAVIANLTLENGYAKNDSGGSYTGANCGGGVTGSCLLTNCVVKSCVADSCGGGVRNYTRLIDCTVTGCSAVNGGATYQTGEIRRCLITGNTATEQGAGIYGNKDVWVYDSTITNNNAGTVGGGMLVGCASNCVICFNSATTAGGYGSWSKVASTAPQLVDCIVHDNRAALDSGYAGGVLGCRMIGGELYGNVAKHGGGAAGGFDSRVCQLVGVTIHDNYAEGYGGGIYCGVLSNCTVSANLANSKGNQAYSSKFSGCDLSKSDTDSSVHIGCVFHNVGGLVTLDSQMYRDTHEGTNFQKNMTAVCRGVPVCTNCLFVNNVMTDYSSRLWVSTSGTVTRNLEIVNCTIVSNQYAGILNYVVSEAFPAKIENCVFFDNRDYGGSELCDIAGRDSSSMKVGCFWLHNCAYGKVSHLPSGKTLSDYSDGPMYKYGADGFGASPMFNFGSKYEYEPKRKSPLRGIGVCVAEKMHPYDIRGDVDGGKYLRVVDGKVDLGCYQCHLPTPPFVMLCR